MATFQAIGSLAQAVARLLEQSWSPTALPGIDPRFEVYQGKDFSTPMSAGVSVFVYQVTLDKVQRSLPPAVEHHRRPLPLVVSLLLTAWGKDASTEHDLLGWVMRAIADNPILPSGLLNSAISGVFGTGETVELTPSDLSNDEVFQLWQVLPSSLQLSVCYLARLVRVESEIVDPTGSPVLIRQLQMAQADG